VLQYQLRNQFLEDPKSIDYQSLREVTNNRFSTYNSTFELYYFTVAITSDEIRQGKYRSTSRILTHTAFKLIENFMEVKMQG